MKIINLLLFFLISISIGIAYKYTNNPVSSFQEEEISALEDLMREHGLLNRLLLVYEEIALRIAAHKEFPRITLKGAVTLMRSFIEEYHEKLEEQYIFPLFEAKNKEIELVRTLKAQHEKGRAITAQLFNLLEKKQLTDEDKASIQNLLCQFISFYRPHEAREDTVLFPQLHSLVSAEELRALGERFEELEHKLFPVEGFSEAVKKVTALEQDLGIYKLLV